MLANVCFLNESKVNANGKRVRWSLVVCPNSQIKVNLNKDGRNTCLYNTPNYVVSES